MTAKKVAVLACLVLTLVIIADMLMVDKALAAGVGGMKGEKEAEAVLHVEKPSWQKIAFGVGMFIAGILSLKYL